MRFLKKTIALVLVFATLVCCFSSCASTGKTLLELENNKISVNVFMLFLSRLKGSIASSYAYSGQVLDDDFWDSVRNADGETNSDFYTDIVLEESKTYLAALYLFDELGLKLPDSYMKDIENELDELVEYDGNGSKTALNSILAKYGANYDVLKEAMIIEAKISYLRDQLFGKNGSKVATELVDEYYNANYVRFKQIFLFTEKILYETDDNGDSIYYKEDGSVSYDVTKTVKRDSNGNAVKDKNGDLIYVDAETGKIAYNAQNGARKELLDKNGNVLTQKYSEEELRKVIDQALIIMDEKVVEGNYTLFDTLIDKYNLDSGMEEFPNGYYMTANSGYEFPEVLKAVLEMDEGEVRMINSDKGIHIVMKYELEEKGYALSANSTFFVNTNTGAYFFMNDLMNKLFSDYLEKYKSGIIVHEKLLEGVDIKSVGENYYY